MPDGRSARVAGPARYACQMHGVGVLIEADDPQVIAAVEVRLRGFPALSAGSPDLRVSFTTSPAPLPPGPGRPLYETPDGSFQYLPDSDALVGSLGAVTVLCDPGSGRATLHSPAFSGRSLYLAAHPILTVCLMEMLKRRRLYSLHAACLAGAGTAGGVLLSGPSGSGKSTLALALARRGLPFLGDDVVFLAGSTPVRALGFADAIGITAATTAILEQLGGQAPSPAPEGFPKRLGRMEDVLGRAAHPVTVPEAIVFPRVAPDAPSALTELDPGSALLRLVPDVLLTEAEATQAHLAAIGALLEQCRCYELVSGRDLDRAAELTAALI